MAMANPDDLICGFCTVVNSFALPAAAIGAGFGGIQAIGEPGALGAIGKGAAIGAAFGMLAGIAALVAYNSRQLQSQQYQFVQPPPA